MWCYFLATHLAAFDIQSSLIRAFRIKSLDQSE